MRIPRQGNVMLERYYAILSKLYKQIGDMLFERKKALAAKGRTRTLILILALVMMTMKTMVVKYGSLKYIFKLD